MADRAQLRAESAQHMQVLIEHVRQAVSLAAVTQVDSSSADAQTQQRLDQAGLSCGHAISEIERCLLTLARSDEPDTPEAGAHVLRTWPLPCCHN
jgi:hypothetical protein